LIEITNSIEAVQDGRIYIELVKAPFLYEHKASPAEYKAGLNLAIARGWLWLHESDSYVKFTPAGAELFAERSRGWKHQIWSCKLVPGIRAE
jgi:hypothetical protein